MDSAQPDREWPLRRFDTLGRSNSNLTPSDSTGFGSQVYRRPCRGEEDEVLYLCERDVPNLLRCG